MLATLSAPMRTRGATRRDLAAAALHWGVLVTLFTGWNWTVNGTPSIPAPAVFGVVVALCFALGRAFVVLAPLPSRCRASLNVRFVIGYLLMNTLLFALSLALPLGTAAVFAIACAAGIAAYAATRRRAVPGEAVQAAPEAIALVVCAIAATLWCRDALEPLVQEGSETVVRLWGDSFVHARLISVFMHAEGFGSLSDIRAAATPVYLYHYASYALPAAVAVLSGGGAYETFASLLLPCGLLLTGLAAYAFGTSLWGPWAGVASAAAVVLVPDAYQQGFGNRYLSYNFMQQAGVAGLYGVALVAVAWIFVLEGCSRGRVASLAHGFVAAGLTLAYKAHVFVANALLVLLYPCFFFRRLAPRWRLLVGAAFVAAFAVALSLGAHLERAPTLRLDGSGAATYLPKVAWNYDAGALGRFFDDRVREHPHPSPMLFVYGAKMLVVSTFGVWIVIAALAAFSLRNALPAPVLWFPLFVVANYLLLSLGLALDGKGIGSPDELLNRPLVWAYFALAAWSGGALFFRLFGERLPARGSARALLAVALALCFAGPLLHAANLQTFPRWGPHFASFKAANSIPTCLITAARFIRAHSRPEDTIQDSDNDIRFIVAAFSERQAFATFATNRPPEVLYGRSWDLGELRRMSDADEIRRFAARHGIVWYLLRPQTDIAWPAAIVAAPAFECDGYRVFRFDR